MPRGAKSRMRRTETPKSIWIKFCMVVDIPDVVIYTNFGDHRLRGFWVAGGQISPSPNHFHRRPYNTLALPCERVMLVYDQCQSGKHCGSISPGEQQVLEPSSELQLFHSSHLMDQSLVTDWKSPADCYSQPPSRQ